jgi:hypothetical protein
MTRPTHEKTLMQGLITNWVWGMVIRGDGLGGGRREVQKTLEIMENRGLSAGIGIGLDRLAGGHQGRMTPAGGPEHRRAEKQIRFEFLRKPGAYRITAQS